MKNVYVIAIFAFFFACKKDEPRVVVVIPNTEISYNLTDSIKVDNYFLDRFMDSIDYFNLDQKVYKTTNNRTSMVYIPKGDSLILLFKDTTENNFEHVVEIICKNKTVNNISETYDLTSNNFCLEVGQQIEVSGYLLGFACQPIMKGVMNLTYDVSTKTLSGSIVGLRYRFGVFLPYTPNPRTYNNSRYAEQSGSTRNQEITFKYVKKG